MKNPIRIVDTAEDILKELRSILRSNINSYVSEKFQDRTSEDIDEFGATVPIPTFEDYNIITGNLETIKLSVERLPCILLDIGTETFEKQITHSSFGYKTYDTSVLICVADNRHDFLFWSIKRVTLAVMQLLMEYSRLNGKCDDGAIQRITYSLPIPLQTGWFRGAEILISYNGLVDP